MKWLTDDACITEKGRPFQTGIVLGKNDYVYAFTEDATYNDMVLSFYIETCMYFDFQTPLARTFLRALKTEVLTDLKGRPQRHTRNMTHIQPLSRGANQRSSTDVTVFRMEQDYQISPYMNTRSSFVSDSPSSLFRPGVTGTGPIESRTSLLARKIRYLGNFFVVSFFQSHVPKTRVEQRAMKIPLY